MIIYEAAWIDLQGVFGDPMNFTLTLSDILLI